MGHREDTENHVRVYGNLRAGRERGRSVLMPDWHRRKKRAHELQAITHLARPSTGRGQRPRPGGATASGAGVNCPG